MKRILTTVGTSLFIHLKKYTNIDENKVNVLLDRKIEQRDKYEKDIQLIKSNALDYLKSKDLNSNEDLKEMSAEIKSIKKIIDCKKLEQYEIILIYTDTLAGEIVSEILEEYLINSDINSVEIRRRLIKNLQMENKVKFERNGISNLVEFIDKMNLDFDSSNLILNITGGYKSVVPYMTIMGYVHEIPVYYIFEETDELIELPLIPIKADEDLFDKYITEIYKIMKKGCIDKDELEEILEDISWQDKEKIKDRILQQDIEEPDFYYPNPISRIFWRKLEKNYLFNIQLSDKAYAFYKYKNNKERAIDILEKVSDYDKRNNPKHYHFIKNIDLECYKSGGKEYFRVFYKVDDKEDRDAIVKVSEIFIDHENYDNFCASPFNSSDYEFKAEIIRKK